jgi:hypothetical protein
VLPLRGILPGEKSAVPAAALPPPPILFGDSSMQIVDLLTRNLKRKRDKSSFMSAHRQQQVPFKASCQKSARCSLLSQQFRRRNTRAAARLNWAAARFVCMSSC